MAWDVLAIAAANVAAVRAQSAALVAADPSGVLAQFRTHADASAASTNVDALKMCCFDELDEVVDARRIEIWRAAGNVVSGLTAFAARQASWLARREAFESLWDGGSSLRYFALNSGGLGTRGRYGDFCLVLADVLGRGRVAAVLPGDSLQRYTTTSSVNTALVRHEATAWSERGSLAVVARQAEAVSTASVDWPAVICRPGAYLETIVGPPLPVADLDEVRLPTDDLDRLADLDAREVDGEELSESELNEVRAYRALQRWRRERGVRISALP